MKNSIAMEKLKEQFDNVSEDLIHIPEGGVFTKESLNDLLKHCFLNDVSDIHIEGGKHIIIDVHGRFYPCSIKKISETEAASLLKKIYDDGAITYITSVNVIDTGYSVKNKKEEFRYRVNAVGSTVGNVRTVQVTIRTLPEIPPELVVVKYGDPLTAEKGQMAVEDVIWDNFTPDEGLIIVTGPTGSGKSTLLATMIRKIIETPNLNKKILTYEEPIEFVYSKVKNRSCFITQTEIGNQIKSWSQAIISALRRAPDIILIGEARDPETISNAILASQTGHLVYSTSHTTSVSASLVRLMNVFPQAERQAKMIDLIESLKLIVAQRLLFTVDGKRCTIKEFLVFTKDIKEELYKCTPENITLTLDKMVKQKRQRLVDDAYLRLQEGVISQKTFDDTEYNYGKLNLEYDDIFNLKEDRIEYLYTNEFIKSEDKFFHHVGIIIDRKSSLHGTICSVSSRAMSKEDFINETGVLFAHTFEEECKNNKEIMIKLKKLFDEYINKNKS